jgi:hypothetical protein
MGLIVKKCSLTQPCHRQIPCAKLALEAFAKKSGGLPLEVDQKNEAKKSQENKV